MGIDTWLTELRKSISYSFDSVHGIPPTRKTRVGILAFDVAGIMSKLTYMWQILSDKNMVRLLNESFTLEGVCKIVSTDETLLLALASAEMVENLKLVSISVSRLSKSCEDADLRMFEIVFDEFANTGCDPHGWVLDSKQMEARIKKMKRFVTATTALCPVMEKKSKNPQHQKVLTEKNDTNLQWQKLKINYFKKKSLWYKSFDTITSLLARTVFTVLSRIKLVFNRNHGYNYPPSLPRGLSVSSTVYPSDQTTRPSIESLKHQENNDLTHGFFEANSKILKPSSTTLGAADLALHYAKLIIVTEKMIRSPQSVGDVARVNIYSILPHSIRASLKRRLKGIVFAAIDQKLASEWREASGNILGWLSPLAHNMVAWQCKRNPKHQNLMPKNGVLLSQTLFFADQQKTEAAITDLLVGLNYIWRFEKEMNAKTLLNCTT